MTTATPSLPVQDTSTDSAPAPIRVDGVSKWFGSVVAVADVTFDVTPGIIGLLGPNGAGKTTLLRMICGLATPSEGTVRVLGESVRDNPEIYRRIGIMSEHESVYGFLTGREFVSMQARLRGVSDYQAATAEAIQYVGLTHAADRAMGTYSRGMRQRMRLGAAIVHDPEIILLDEPLSGTDPRQRLEFQRLLRDLAARGRTIVISSHILEEVESLADRVLLVVSGKLAASGDYRTIREKLDERPYHVRIISDDQRALAANLFGLEAVDAVSIGDEDVITVLSSNVGILQRSVAKLARDSGVRLLRVDPLDDSLESVFSYLVEG